MYQTCHCLLLSYVSTHLTKKYDDNINNIVLEIELDFFYLMWYFCVKLSLYYIFTLLCDILYFKFKKLNI